jgi:sterol desaturase/sphingolipid hydroxylase (fatty acid hydroxylase superfamily)
MFFLGQYLVWGGLIVYALSYVESVVHGFVPEALREQIRQQPMWLQGLEAVVLGDFAIYWVHRLQHSVNCLWRFHAVHHTAEHLDWVAAFREHPLDGLMTQLTINLPAFLIGFPIQTLAALVVFRGLWAVYIHSNVRLLLGPLKLLIGSPELHHWHHSKERMSSNFGNLSPLMDVLFGTYRSPAERPKQLGVSEFFPRSYLGQLLHPFRRLKP